MLVETIVILLLLLPLSTVVAWSLRSDLDKPWKWVVMIFGPVVDPWLVWLLMDWLEMGGAATWGCVISMGIISLFVIQPFVSPRRVLVMRLSLQQVRRRPRQAALLMAGLLIASSIITSSLVVGDSLDSTMTAEVEAVYGDTDLLVYRYDDRTGSSLDLPQNLTEEMAQTLSESGMIQGWSHGIESTATLAAVDGKAVPSAGWFAHAGWSGIVVNQVASDELGVKAGDSLKISWYNIGKSGQLERESKNLTIDKVIPNQGKGAMSGTRSPAIFTSLELAQDLKNMEWQVNRIRLDLTDGMNARDSIQQIESMFDELITAEDSGFEINTADDSLSITYTEGLGRLSASFMDSWEENSTALIGDGSVMEVLQVPLIQIEQGVNILSLPDDRIKEILIAEDGDWYVSGGAVSFQNDRGGDSHGWQVPDGGLVHDVELGDGYLLVAHSDGLVEISEDPDADINHLVEGQEVLVAMEPTIGLPELPSTVFSIDHLNASGTHYIAVKHLTGFDVHEYDGQSWTELDLDGEWLHYDGELMVGTQSGWVSESGLTSPDGWTGISHGLLLNGTSLHRFDENYTFLASLESECDSRVVEYDGDLLCSTEYGSLVASNSVTPRLPLTVDIGGFGEMPQLLLATDGPLSPEQGEILVSNRLSLLDESNNMRINGLVPWAYGDTTPLILDHGGSMDSIDAPGLDDLQGIIIGLVNLSEGEVLAAADEGERSMLVVSGGDRAAIESWLDQIAGVESYGIGISAVKEDSIAAAEESAGVLSAMFLVFGTFTIGAGILLVLVIVIMLGEARRVDEAVLRAVGMKRSDMRALSLFEGMLVSSFASVAGGIFGLFLAWLISLAFSSIFNSVGADGISFSFELDSMLIGASSGFIVAMATLFASALWTSRLNIVQGLRGINPMRSTALPWWLVLLLIVFLGGGMLTGLSILTIPSSSSLRIAMWHMSASLFLMGLVPIFTFVAPQLLGRSMRNAGRNTMSALGLTLMLWALTPDSWAPVDSGVRADEITFAVLGMIQVFAGVMILAGIAPRVASWFGRRNFVTRRFGPVVNISLAHPAAAPLRTAVIMGMFSLTVFSVVVLSGYSIQFEEHSSGYVEDASGDFEILLTSSRMAPIELTSDPNEWGLENASADDVDAVGRVSRAVAWVEKGEDRIPYVIRGVDSGFVDHGGIPLEQWDPALGDTSQEAWKSMQESSNLVFVDSSFALIDPNTGQAISGVTIPIGESILLIDISNPGNEREVKVAGILSESSQLFSAGIWMSGEIVDEQFGGVVTRVYVSHPAGVDSAELEDKLSQDLASKGTHSTVIADEILLLLGLVFSILSIFQAYLALGLLVGIAGIGVVTYRSVSERTGEIGMLRALGLRRKSVMGGMILEISWVSLLGMLNGAAVGVAFHIGLHDAFWKEQGVDLVLPWGVIFGMLLGGWALVLASTWLPVSKAMKVTPSEALSSVD